MKAYDGREERDPREPSTPPSAGDAPIPTGGDEPTTTPTTTPQRTPNPRPPSPVLGPPASDPEPNLRRPRVKPTLGMAGSEEGGTFALPGSRGARPFRSGAFGQNRVTGRFGPGTRFEGASPFSGIGSMEDQGMGPLGDDELYSAIAQRLLG